MAYVLASKSIFRGRYKWKNGILLEVVGDDIDNGIPSCLVSIEYERHDDQALKVTGIILKKYAFAPRFCEIQKLI